VNDLAQVPNEIAAFTDCVALRAASFFGDFTPPVLTNWKLDMHAEYAELSFSETVNVSTIDVTQLTFADDAVAGSGSGTRSDEFTLTTGIVTLISQTMIRVNIESVDLNLIKLLDSIGKTKADSRLLYTSDLITDMAGNPIASNLVMPIEAKFWVVDGKKPFIAGFEFDLTLGTLTATFSEAVRLSSFNADKITLHSNVGASASNVPLTTPKGRTSISTNGTILTVNVSFADANAVKLTIGLGTLTTNTRLSATGALLSDMQGNTFDPVDANGNQIFASFVAQDRTPPQLTSFDFDFSSEQLVLRFSETVSASSLQMGLAGITLQDSEQAFKSNPAAPPDYAFNLTGGQVVTSDGFTQIVNLTTCDLDNLKRLEGVATTENNTFIAFTANIVSDLNGNSVIAIPDGSAVPVTQFTKDKTAPTLKSFRVEMHEMGPPLRLILTFSETVDATKLDLTKFILQDASDAAQANNAVRLTKGTARALPPSCVD
jgi:hypothetical protein